MASFERTRAACLASAADQITKGLEPMATTLSPSRKADRAKLADQLAAFVEARGFAATVEHSWPGPGCDKAMVRIEAAGATVGVTIGKFEAVNPYCTPWNIAHQQRELRFSSAFGRAVRSEVNPFHRRKCMGFETGFEALLAGVGRALDCIKAEKAFQE